MDEREVADPGAVRAALSGDAGGEASGGGEAGGRTVGPDIDRVLSLSTGSAVRRATVALSVAGLFVVARALAYDEIFRDGEVVLAGNDPYYYRYWVDRLLAESSDPLALDTLVDTTSGGANKVFVLVPSARVVGTAPGNATLELRTTVEIPNDEFTYRTVTTASESGRYRVVVPYPGEYTVRTDDETRTVSVPESDAENGTRVAVGG